MGWTMFGGGSTAADLDRATVDAISKSQAIIEFNLDGTVIAANPNFLSMLGYGLSEVVGQHDRMFLDPVTAGDSAYLAFWDRLRRGQFEAGEYKRIGKAGNEVWIRATYNPVFDRGGKPVKVVTLAFDVTRQKLASADAQGQLAAISRSQAVIEFSMAGEILSANENFCAALGYHIDEIRNRHHRMFVEPNYASGSEYRDFWEKLGRGEYHSAEYKRIGKGGRDVWIQATYNPIFDPDGKPYKVVKYATDITARKSAVNMLGDGLARLAEGDLTARIDTRFVGELEEVRLAFNQTVGRFSEILGRLRDTSRALKTATGEILSGANDLAERTTRQAASIEETSAAMEQLSATVADNAKRAEAASTKSKAQSLAAEQAGQVMVDANTAMEGITASSARISSIIGLMDDIAFQTNLLALNASVEAARAGDAGKGFAVVAVEVRRLAQSAASASNEIKLLIERSAHEVASGSKLVSEAAIKLTDMRRALRETNDLINGIAQASQEQSVAISQVSTAIRKMDEMTQHNAALVEQTNAAIEQTEAQATELDQIVEVFVVDDGRRRLEKRGIKALQASARSAGKAYLLRGNAALKPHWNEF